MYKEVRSTTLNKYGYDTGSWTSFPADESNYKILARLDWNITIHQLALTAAKEIGQRHAIGEDGVNEHRQHANHTSDFSTHFHPGESQEQEHEQG